MPSEISERFEKAIREEDEKALGRIREIREGGREAGQEFQSVRQAAEEIQDELQSIQSIKFTINPDSVWISLADREVWIGYEIASRKFVGGEIAHSWYDGEPFTDDYTWERGDLCI